MKKYKLEVPYIVSKFEKHKEVKKTLLSLIDETPANSLYEASGKISRSDWLISDLSKKKYIKYIQPLINKHISQVYDEIGYDNFKIGHCWFQQYMKNDSHGWHQHRGASWSNVYYVELEKDGPKTIFKNPFNLNEIVIPEVEEGDILTLPGLAWHCSEPNQSTNRKTVYVFNVF